VTSVLHVISGLGMGGAERNLAQVAGGLQRAGMQQYVACIRPSEIWSEALTAQGVPVFQLDVDGALKAPFGLARLVSIVRRLRPDCVQGWMYHGDLFAALAHRLAGGRGRLFWNLRASDTAPGGYGGLVRLNAVLSGWPDAIVANSQAGLDYHKARGYRPRRAVVIANGIDTDAFRPDPQARIRYRRELGLADDAPVAIHVARVDPMKDHAMFIAAMAQAPQMTGLMVGAGTQDLPHPGNVRALGLRRDVAALYAAADFVVSTSAYAEGFSNVIAEGMSCGLVPLATDIGDARVIVGDCGHVIAAGDAAALARLLAAQAAQDAEERARRGVAARARIVDNFALAVAQDRYARLYSAGDSDLQ
jgi:glycosyltransferase involved in cell wall biosynthesis